MGEGVDPVHSVRDTSTARDSSSQSEPSFVGPLFPNDSLLRYISYILNEYDVRVCGFLSPTLADLGGF